MGKLAEYLADQGGFVSSLLGALPIAVWILPCFLAVMLRPPQQAQQRRSPALLMLDLVPAVSMLVAAVIAAWVWTVWCGVNEIAPRTISRRGLIGIWIVAIGLAFCGVCELISTIKEA